MQKAVLEGVEKKRMAFLNRLPSQVRGFFERAYKGDSRAAACKAKCIDCTGWEEYKLRIGDCQTVSCPLHPYRPYQKGSDDE